MHLRFYDGRVSLAEADGPGFESFRIAALWECQGKLSWSRRRNPFPWPKGPRIKTIRGSALNLSPLARLLLPDQLVPLISVPVFITGKEMVAGLILMLDWLKELG